MAIQRYDPTPPWETFEVVLRDERGQLDTNRRPFSAALEAGGEQPSLAIGRMWLAQYHGWPQAARSMRDDQGHAVIVRADNKTPEIWILKCKPSCWRLYFHVYKDQKRFAYLFARCKKADSQNAGDAKRARK